jgi:hypothetical protein
MSGSQTRSAAASSLLDGERSTRQRVVESVGERGIINKSEASPKSHFLERDSAKVRDQVSHLQCRVHRILSECTVIRAEP